MSTNFITTATWLTLVRLIISPIVLPILLVYGLPVNNIWLNGSLTSLFVLFGLTDFLDGYIARKYNQKSILGKVLDPVADKFLFYSTLIGLLVADRILFYWVIILIGREFFVMALRHVALEHGFNISVSWLGKIKTTIQIIAISFIIFNPCHGVNTSCALLWNNLEFGLLFFTIFLSVFSAYRYYKIFMQMWSEYSEKGKTGIYCVCSIACG